MQQRSILKADQKENVIKTLHVSRDNIIPFLEIREGSDDTGKKQGTHPRGEFVEAGEKYHTIFINKMEDELGRLQCLVQMRL
jgi:hypothetical protein